MILEPVGIVVLVNLRRGENADLDVIRQLIDQWPNVRITAFAPISSDEGREAAKTGDSQFPATLTPREQDVLYCLAMGYDNREIADKLTVAIRTVNRHLENIRRKLGRTRRSELIRFAREYGSANHRRLAQDSWLSY